MEPNNLVGRPILWEKNLVIIVNKKLVGEWYTMVIMDSILWGTCMWKTMDFVLFNMVMMDSLDKPVQC
jgi:hypothetical protein